MRFTAANAKNDTQPPTDEPDQNVMKLQMKRAGKTGV